MLLANAGHAAPNLEKPPLSDPRALPVESACRCHQSNQLARRAHARSTARRSDATLPAGNTARFDAARAHPASKRGRIKRASRSNAR